MHPAAAHPEPHAARVRQPDAHACVFHGAGNARESCALVSILHGLKRFNKAGGSIRNLAVRQHLPRADGVYVAYLPRAYAYFVRHAVEHGFHCKAGLRNAEAAERPRRGIVCIVRIAVYFKILIVVRPRRMGASTLQHRPAKAGIRARVRNNGCLHALNNAVFVAAQREFHVHRVALWVNEYAFRAGKLNLYGAACKVRGKRRMMLNANVLLAAEAAAHKLVFNIYLFHGQTQHGGCLVLSIIYALVGGIYLHPAVPRQCHGALRFKKCVLGKGRCVFAVQYMLAFRYRARRVPAGNMLMRKQIAAFVQHWRAVGHCLVCIAHGGEFLVIYLYKRLCGLHSLRRFAHHQCNRVAQIPCAVAFGYHGVPVLFKVTYLVLPRYVLGGKYGYYALGRLRFCGIYFQYARAGVFGAQCACVCHAVDVHIVRVFAVPKHLFAHVKAGYAAAHGPRLILRGYCALPHKPCRKLNGVYYFNIARAAANVAS